MKQKTNLLVVVLVALVAGFVGAYFAPHKGGAVAEAKKETAYERVLRTGVLRCGYAMWPPGVFTKDPNTGKFSGMMYDITEAMAKSLNLKVEWAEETGWTGWIEGLKSGRFDTFCAGVFQNGARGREARFTRPVFYTPVHAFARIDDTRFDQNLDGVNNPSIRISGQDGEISEIIARTLFPKAAYVGQPQISDLTLIFMNVADGKADIVFNGADVAEDYTSKNPGKLKRVTREPFQVFSTAYGVAMGEVNLQQMMDSAIIELQNSGIINKIMKDNNMNPEFFLQVNKPYQVTEQK